MKMSFIYIRIDNHFGRDDGTYSTGTTTVQVLIPSEKKTRLDQSENTVSCKLR